MKGICFIRYLFKPTILVGRCKHRKGFLKNKQKKTKKSEKILFFNVGHQNDEKIVGDIVLLAKFKQWAGSSLATTIFNSMRNKFSIAYNGFKGECLMR